MPLSTTVATVSAVSGSKQAAALILTSFAAFWQMLAAFALTQVRPETAVWSVSEFRAYCLLGSIGGAFLKIWVFASAKLDNAPTSSLVRRLSGEFFASGICGLLFSPMVFRYMGWEPDVDMVLAVCGAVSFVGLAVLNVCSHKVVDWANARADAIIGREKKDN